MQSKLLHDRIAYKYAKALLQLAIERGALANVYADMFSLDRIYVEDTSLMNILKSPIVAQGKKLSVLQAIFQEEVHDLTLSFFAIVMQKHRGAMLPAMVRSFLAQHDQYQSIKRVQVTTASPLSDRLILQLQQVAQRLSPCRQVILEKSTDLNLIGGYVLQVDDIRLDQSLRKNLLTLQKNCVTTGY